MQAQLAKDSPESTVEVDERRDDRCPVTSPGGQDGSEQRQLLTPRCPSDVPLEVGDDLIVDRRLYPAMISVRFWGMHDLVCEQPLQCTPIRTHHRHRSMLSR